MATEERFERTEAGIRDLIIVSRTVLSSEANRREAQCADSSSSRDRTKTVYSTVMAIVSSMVMRLGAWGSVPEYVAMILNVVSAVSAEYE
jgi:hypothetical protein